MLYFMDPTRKLIRYIHSQDASSIQVSQKSVQRLLCNPADKPTNKLKDRDGNFKQLSHDTSSKHMVSLFLIYADERWRKSSNVPPTVCYSVQIQHLISCRVVFSNNIFGALSLTLTAETVTMPCDHYKRFVCT